jgi:hypothetical protein
MKEELLLEQIKKIIVDKYIGDNCAYLKVGRSALQSRQ